MLSGDLEIYFEDVGRALCDVEEVHSRDAAKTALHAIRNAIEKIQTEHEECRELLMQCKNGKLPQSRPLIAKIHDFFKTYWRPNDDVIRCDV